MARNGKSVDVRGELVELLLQKIASDIYAFAVARHICLLRCAVNRSSRLPSRAWACETLARKRPTRLPGQRAPRVVGSRTGFRWSSEVAQSSDLRPGREGG